MSSVHLNGEKLWFTSDPHFGHKAAAQHRGFGEDVDAMNDAILTGWKCMRPEDTLVIIGDLSFLGTKKTVAILEQVNVKMILVHGNHDKGLSGATLNCFANGGDILTVKVDDPTPEDPAKVQRIVCCHYPMLTWDMAHHGAWHLHGHSHGNAVYPHSNTTMMDVGVDTNRTLMPYSYKYVKNHMAHRTYRATDHHGKQGGWKDE